MYISHFLDKKSHNIKLKNWDRDYISIQIEEDGAVKIQYWDNNKFEWLDYVFTMADLTNENWIETEL